MTKAELIQFLEPFKDDTKIIWKHGPTRSVTNIEPQYFCANDNIYRLGENCFNSPPFIRKGEWYVLVNRNE